MDGKKYIFGASIHPDHVRPNREMQAKKELQVKSKNVNMTRYTHKSTLGALILLQMDVLQICITPNGAPFSIFEHVHLSLCTFRQFTMMIPSFADLRQTTQHSNPPFLGRPVSRVGLKNTTRAQFLHNSIVTEPCFHEDLAPVIFVPLPAFGHHHHGHIHQELGFQRRP